MNALGLGKRTSELDVIKGLMIVLMVFGHLDYVGTARHILGGITEVMHTFRMPIFMVLCGYFFSPLRPTEELMRKTVRTILVPYIAFLSFYIVLMWLLQSQGAQPKDAVNLSLAAYFNAILIKPVGVYWFLHALVLFQLSTILAVYCARMLKTNAWLGILMAFMMVIHYFQLTSLVWIQFFAIGLLLKHFKTPLPASPLIGIGLVIAIALFGVNQQVAGMLTGNAFLCALWAMAILSVLNGLLKAFPNAPTVTLWRFVGQNTLIVLLTHTFFLSVIKRTFNEKLIGVEPTGLFHMAVVLTIAVGGPILGAWLIDRTGLTSLVFGKPRLFVGWREANGKKAENASGPGDVRTPATAPAAGMIGSTVAAGHPPLNGSF